ncbi:MAG: ABC transporter permease subunit [Halobacteriovoraceae bacterium]|nr:ABC transporter permease subunit [Halobacteriovoraceae bacterium]
METPLKEFWNSFKENRGAVIGLALIVFFLFLALFAPLIAPYDPTQLQDNALKLNPLFAGGTSEYLLGTDDVGRDILSRLIYGARISMSVGFFVVLISASIGTVLGLMAGYLGGKVDWFIMRLVDILMAFPSILLAIVVVSVMGPGLSNAIVAVAIVSCPTFIRIVRASAMGEKGRQYVMASQTFGANPARIMFVEILPNCMAPLIVQISLGFSDGILNAAALGFLGLGAQAPTPEWGIMLSDARAFISSHPWMVTLPGLCILLVVLGFNLLGDGLRDALDPRLKK